jgi:CBS-domain-containing membrane protein
MNIADCMKRNVASLTTSSTVREAIAQVIRRHIGTLPIVDENGKLVGMVKLYRLLSIVMPDFVHLIEDFSFLHGFGAMDTRLPEPEQLDCPIEGIMEEPVWVEDDSSLLYASAVLHKNELLDIPVVDDQCHLIGIASHVDIGTALMKTWLDVPDYLKPSNKTD